ncbi:MAG: FHA domain-containing protein [Phycisphaerales bacterium]
MRLLVGECPDRSTSVLDALAASNSRRLPLELSLVMVKADGSTKEVRIDRESAIIGREEGCRIRIPLSSISRKHCEVKSDDDEVLVQDLGSSNGTYVNGKRVKQQELAPGDLLCVGPVVFVVRIDGHPRQIDAKDSFAAGSVTDENDDSGDLSSPKAPTATRPSSSPSGPPPAVRSGGPGNMGKKSLLDDDDDDFSDLLKNLREEDDDEDPKKK